jgi:hypothetical protein
LYAKSISDLQGELAHRFVKRLYSRTNKKNVVRQIAKNERRSTRLRHAREAAAAPQHHHIHHVQFSDSDSLPHTNFYQHHHMSDSKNFSHHLMNFVSQPPNDPAKKVDSFMCSTYFYDQLLYRILFQSSKAIY